MARLRAISALAGVLVTAGATPARAQTSTATTTEASLWDHFTPLPVVFYVPETSLALGAMAIYTFRAPGNGPEHRETALTARAFYTLEGQTVAWFSPTLWWGGDDYSLTGFFEYRDYPFRFYGVTNDPEDFEAFTERAFEAQPTFRFRVWQDLRIGLSSLLWIGEVVGFPEDGRLASGEVLGTGSARHFGVGPSASWDSRDSIYFPTDGVLATSRLLFFEPGLGSDLDFARFELDVRGYWTPWLDHVIAAQGLLHLTAGAAPFVLLPQLGGSSLHRGWFQGSLRGPHALLAQVEYRAPIWWRLGLVAFGSAGQVADDLEGFGLSRTRFAGGAGLRVRLNEAGTNARFDAAWGSGFAFYFQINEAF